MPISSNWLKFLKNIISTLTLVLVFFSFFATFAGPVVSLRGLDGSLGIIKQPMEKGDKIIANKVRRIFSEPIKAEALGFGDVLGAITQGVTKVLMEIIKAIVEFVVKIFETIVGTILDLINDVLSFIDDFINLLEKLADFINATRVGLAFLVFKDIQNSANISNSGDFTRELLNQSSQSLNKSSSGSGLAVLNPEVFDIINDAVAWMDFTNAQRALQADLVSDVYKKITGFDLQTYQDMEDNVANLLTGMKCSTSALENIGTFGVLFKAYNPCIAEKGNVILGNLRTRQSQITTLATQKVQQFQLRAPDDCKARSYIKYEKSGSFSYTSGNLKGGIIGIADKIEVINPTPEECQLVKEGRKEKRESIRQLIEPSNLALLFGNAAAYLELVKKAFADLFKEIKDSIKKRWENVKDIIKNIQLNNLGLYVVSTQISTTTQNEIRTKLKQIQKDYGSFKVTPGGNTDINSTS
jgi:hypothetical protein